jgi:RHS repeat-associated protein
MLLQRHHLRVCCKTHKTRIQAQRVFKTAPLYAVTNPEETAPQDIWTAFTTFFESLWSPSTNPDGSTVQKAGMSYVYDEDGTLIAQTLTGGAQSSWGQSARYIYLPTASGPMPVAAIYGTKHYAIQSDHLNTPRRLIQSDGQVAWQWAYSAFGEEKPTTAKTRFANADLNQSFGTTAVPAVTFNLRYPGQYFDQESNLHYNYHRSYSATVGGYTQVDPIGLQGGWNGFAYSNQNPLSFTDPLGLTSIKFDPIAGLLTVDPEIAGRAPYTIQASSGRPECGCSPNVKDNGPIPSGNYTIFTSQVSNPGFFGDVARNTRGDWGDWRVPLIPNSETPTFGRSGFFLHGGKYAGSAGCIDVGGGTFGNSQTNQLLKDIKNDPDGRVPVKVEWTSSRVK